MASASHEMYSYHSHPPLAQGIMFRQEQLQPLYSQSGQYNNNLNERYDHSEHRRPAENCRGYCRDRRDDCQAVGPSDAERSVQRCDYSPPRRLQAVGPSDAERSAQKCDYSPPRRLQRGKASNSHHVEVQPGRYQDGGSSYSCLCKISTIICTLLITVLISCTVTVAIFLYCGKISLSEKLPVEDDENISLGLSNTAGGSFSSNNALKVFLQQRTSDRLYNGIDLTVDARVTHWETGHVTAKSKNYKVRFNPIDGDFTVMDAGRYVVCSVLHFVAPRFVNGKNLTAFELTPVWFGQKLLLRGSTLLEDSVVTLCRQDDGGSLHDDGTSPLQCYSSRLFAVLYLGKESTVSVNAKPENLISDQFQKSYFSIYRLA